MLKIPDKAPLKTREFENDMYLARKFAKYERFLQVAVRQSVTRVYKIYTLNHRVTDVRLSFNGCAIKLWTQSD
jgi:hypothetical protein